MINYWKQAWAPVAAEPELETEGAPWEGLMQRDAIMGDKDELVEQAIEVIRRTGKSSASHLQRALRIGYPRAARLVDELEVHQSIVSRRHVLRLPAAAAFMTNGLA